MQWDLLFSTNVMSHRGEIWYKSKFMYDTWTFIIGIYMWVFLPGRHWSVWLPCVLIKLHKETYWSMLKKLKYLWHELRNVLGNEKCSLWITVIEFNSNQHLLSTEYVSGCVQAVKGWQRCISSLQRTDTVWLKNPSFEGATVPVSWCLGSAVIPHRKNVLKCQIVQDNKVSLCESDGVCGMRKKEMRIDRFWLEVIWLSLLTVWD